MTARSRHVLTVLHAALVVAVVATLTCPPAYAGAAPARGRWPLHPRPEVVHRFDPPAQRWESGHRGVDLAGTVGQPVHAALPGQVTFAGRVAGVGVVVVDHGDTRTTYQPVTPAVTRGDHVAAGQVLGSLSWVGTHCLPQACLHWGWLRGSTYLDPLLLVGGPRPVRLLPSSAAGSVDGSGGAGVPVDGAAGTAAAPVLGPALAGALELLGGR